MTTNRSNDRPVESSLPSRAQLPVRDDEDTEAVVEPVTFDWTALGALAVTLCCAVAGTTDHLHGHAAGVVSGFLLGVGVVALVAVLWSIVEIVRDRWSA